MKPIDPLLLPLRPTFISWPPPIPTLFHRIDRPPYVVHDKVSTRPAGAGQQANDLHLHLHEHARVVSLGSRAPASIDGRRGRRAWRSTQRPNGARTASSSTGPSKTTCCLLPLWPATRFNSYSLRRPVCTSFDLIAIHAVAAASRSWRPAASYPTPI